MVDPRIWEEEPIVLVMHLFNLLPNKSKKEILSDDDIFTRIINYEKLYAKTIAEAERLGLTWVGKKDAD